MNSTYATQAVLGVAADGRSFRGAIDAVRSLTDLDQSLTKVGNAIVDSLKPSFSTWKLSTVQNKFASKNCLDIEDEGFIMSRLDNSDWVADWYVDSD